MSRIFITGSADGLGLLTAKSLLKQGHEVVLHARNAQRKAQTAQHFESAPHILVADLSDLEEIKDLAGRANEHGHFDAVIHNAAIYHSVGKEIFTVNMLAPYLLTCLILRPRRLIYMTSDMHVSGDPDPGLFDHIERITYSDSKLHMLTFAQAVSGRWPDVYVNAVDPGWMPTKMGGRGAPGDLRKGYETQAWLAVSEDNDAKVTGQYFFQKRQRSFKAEAMDSAYQDSLLKACVDVTGVSLP